MTSSRQSTQNLFKCSFQVFSQFDLPDLNVEKETYDSQTFSVKRLLNREGEISSGMEGHPTD